MFAVSQKVMPSSTACRKIGSAASSSSAHGIRLAGSPKLMQPSAMRLTFSPDVPRRVYSMVWFLSVCGPAGPFVRWEKAPPVSSTGRVRQSG